MTTFVDTDVIIYLLDPGSPFHGWAKAAAIRRRTEGPLIISDIVYSELSMDLQSIDATDEVINLLALERIGFTKQALFRAGKAFAEYRKRGGPKTNVLSDFLIGAQAETAAAPLLTNNRKDFCSYFQSIVLITPTTFFLKSSHFPIKSCPVVVSVGRKPHPAALARSLQQCASRGSAPRRSCAIARRRRCRM